MIKFENTHVDGFEVAIRGMRMPMMSHSRMDSHYDLNIPLNSDYNWTPYLIGENDLQLAQKLLRGGNEHSKCLRMVHISTDLTAPRYFWQEIDTYHFSTKNSSSTMHTLLNNESPILLDQFVYDESDTDIMILVITRLEKLRNEYRSMQKNGKVVNRQEKLDKLLRRAKMMLPEGFLQVRTWDTNYAELRNIYFQRRNHRLPEWHEVCHWIENLPYGKELITYTEEN